jgi:cold shock CspA family protein
MPTGRVKWFSLEKGFGFISSDEGEDVYLAATALPEGVPTVKPGRLLLLRSLMLSGEDIRAFEKEGFPYASSMF